MKWEYVVAAGLPPPVWGEVAFIVWIVALIRITPTSVGRSVDDFLSPARSIGLPPLVWGEASYGNG